MGTVFCHCLSRLEHSSPAFCDINFMLRAQQSQKTLKSHLLVKYKKHLSGAKSAKEMLNCTWSWQNLRLRLQEKTLAVKVHKIYPNLSDYFLRKSPFELLFNRRTNVQTSMLNKAKSFSLGQLKFFYQRADRPGCSCNKEETYKAKWKAVRQHWWCRTIEHGLANWNLQHRTFNYMLGK